MGKNQSYILQKVEEIISENVNLFLQRIHNLSNIGPYRDSRITTPDFKMFAPATKEYYEYNYFEQSLECYIRENLINKIIPQMLNLHEIECLLPDFGNTHYVGYNNESIEDVFPFEFIINNDKGKTGYRYTGPCWEDKELKEIFRRFRIKKVVVIDWSDGDNSSSNKTSWGISPQLQPLVVKKTAKDFFLSLFSIEEYELFVNSIRKAVQEANKEIGFTTIPSLSLSYLSKFKEDEKKYLSEIDYTKLVFKETGRSHPIKNLLTKDDFINLDRRFIEKGFYKALVGSEEFAISFITSEYMFQILRNGGQFDYTAVVCGYIKSIEQLLYKMLQSTLIYKGSRSLMIKPANSGEESIREVRIKNPNNKKKWLIPFEKRYEENFDITLGSMIWFVNDNEKGWYLSLNGKNTVRRYLLNYSTEDRNEHFHKDNIYDIEEAKRIRNNTITLMYFLIGGYYLSGDPDLDREILGIYDDNFDRMYKRMTEVPLGNRRFYLKFKNGDEIKAVRLYEQDRPKYDKKGSLRESVIRFVKVDNFDEDYHEIVNRAIKDTLIVDCNHVPEQIWLSLGDGQRMPIEW